jgi:hypothetical protein
MAKEKYHKLISSITTDSKTTTSSILTTISTSSTTMSNGNPDLSQVTNYLPGICHDLYNNSYILQTLCQFPLTVANLHLIYLCMLLSLLTIIVSIFGKIDGDYKWFILNQSIIELLYLLLYNFCHHLDSKEYVVPVCLGCVNYVANSHEPKFDPSCQTLWWKRLIIWVFYAERSMVYFMSVLLTFSRFMILFRRKIYERFFKAKTLLPIILGYDFIARLYNTALGRRLLY